MEELSSLFGGGAGSGGSAGTGPSSSATASNNFGSGGGNEKWIAAIAAAFVAIVGLIIVSRS